MRYLLFSAEWAGAWGEALRANEDYRRAASSWKWPLVLTMSAAPEAGLPEERAVYLDLFHGDCREARVDTAADVAAVPYIISADPATWKRVLEREIEPLSGLMRGKLKLAKGSLTALIPYVSAAKEMVLAATRIGTLFPDALR